jgi:hypothetical protein
MHGQKKLLQKEAGAKKLFETKKNIDSCIISSFNAYLDDVNLSSLWDKV